MPNVAPICASATGVLAVGLVCGPAAAASPTPVVHRSSYLYSIVVREHQVSNLLIPRHGQRQELINLGPGAPFPEVRPGDVFRQVAIMYQGGTRIGKDIARCVVTRKDPRCDSTVTFTDGTMRFRGWNGNQDHRVDPALSEGTGAYRGARGTFHDAPLPKKPDSPDYRVTFVYTFCR